MINGHASDEEKKEGDEEKKEEIVNGEAEEKKEEKTETTEEKTEASKEEKSEEVSIMKKIPFNSKWNHSGRRHNLKRDSVQIPSLSYHLK